METVITAKEAFGSVSIVIPAYNARAVVNDTLTSVQAYLRRADLSGEILVVDDGSTDDTAECVRRQPGDVKLLSYSRNRGKGHAVRYGMRQATQRWALFMDVDNSTTVDHLDRFAPHAHDADVLIASRRLEDSRIVRPQPAFRQMLGRTFPFLTRALALPGIRDTQCGFKLFRREVALELFSRQQCAGFCFDVEILLMAQRLGYTTREVAIDWDNPPSSTVRLSLDPLCMFIDLLRIRRRHRSAKYRPVGTAVAPPTGNP